LWDSILLAYDDSATYSPEQERFFADFFWGGGMRGSYLIAYSDEMNNRLFVLPVKERASCFWTLRVLYLLKHLRIIIIEIMHAIIS
jgi:hypothetical protein